LREGEKGLHACKEYCPWANGFHQTAWDRQGTTRGDDLAEREAFLSALGFLVIRFTNQDVTINLKGVLQKIVEESKK
jgi:hypothetical protein